MTPQKAQKTGFSAVCLRQTALLRLIFAGWLVAGIIGQTNPADAQSLPKPPGELARLALLEGESQSEPPSETILWGGLEFKLAPKVKTYWRTVGDSGLPPVFSWAGSRNLQSVEVLWPAPVRFQDGAGFSIGYQDHVLLPLKVVPLDPKQPVLLKLSLDYAVCETLCMPAHFDGSLTLSPKSSRATASQLQIRQAQAKVPVVTALGADAPLSLRRVSGQPDGLVLETRWPSGSLEGDLFVEGPEGWVFSRPELLSNTADPQNGDFRRYRVTIEEKPRSDSTPGELALAVTLVAPSIAVETRVTLDKAGQAP